MRQLNKRKKIIELANDYFDYMAENYPVMCSCDEFYFFPRVKRSIKFLNILDNLDKQKIIQNISYLKNLKKSLDKINSKNLDLEAQADLILLSQSISTFLRQFQKLKIFKTDPNLYLKIILFGIDQILTHFSYIRPNFQNFLLSRMEQIPRLLNEAKDNLSSVSSRNLEVAQELIDSSIEYFKSTDFNLKNKANKIRLNTLNKKNLQALLDFKKFLKKRPTRDFSIKNRQFLKNILIHSFSYNRSLNEIYDIASREYHKTIRELRHIAKKIHSRKSWQEILAEYNPKVNNQKALLRLYSQQIRKLKNFFKQKDIITIPRTQNIKVMLTPRFMQPVRASASYGSPLTNDLDEPAQFYITLASSIHNEYMFVSAHETYPGHHLLDSIRRHLTNPVRGQIESPLFYEGWASYAERLIDELGYIKDPYQELVGLRRQAWRAIRAMLDVGIRINKLKPEGAGELLKNLGYESKIVKSMLRHYILTPGYQLCYTIGKYEIERLKDKYSKKLGLKKFHDFLLKGGELPFNLIEKRIKNKLCKKNS